MYKVECVAFEGKNESSIRFIRKTVFIDEQNVPLSMEFDGEDGNAIHILAQIGGVPIGTGRMLKDGHIGRVAVLKSHRQQGAGKQLMLFFMDWARKEGYPRVYLSAQTQALVFYEKLGFTAYGNEYLEAGIKHFAMEMPLTNEIM